MARDIIVYSTPLCAPCERLKRFLGELEIEFTSTDLMLDEAAAELVESRGIHSSPVLGIDGKLYAGKALALDNLVKILAG